MAILTPEAAVKLQKILSKRLGYELTQKEIEIAYENLMGFAFALLDLTENDEFVQAQNPKMPCKKNLYSV